jgi:glycosyltransferase involved in cell wall biosynthesis
MRVLSIIHYAFYGGPQNRNTRLTPILKDMGVDTVVLLPDENGNAYRIMKEKGVNVIKMPLHRLRATKSIKTHFIFLVYFIKEVRKIKKYILSENIDVVLVNGLVNPHGVIAAKLAGVPVVWQILDTRTPKVLGFVMMLLAKMFSAVIMSTGYKVAKAHPFAVGFKERLVCFYPPVDTEKFVTDSLSREQVRKDLGIPENAFLVATVGNINPQKGHEYFIETASLLVNMNELQDVDIYFLIIGTNMPTHESYRKKLEGLVTSYGLDQDNCFRIMKAQYPINNLLSAFDVFIQSSVPLSEGIPTAILEAISCGLPVVSSDVGSISEVVLDGSNGYVVPPMKPEHSANAIKKLLCNRNIMSSMSDQARGMAEQKFGLKSCARSHKQAFEIAAK